MKKKFLIEPVQLLASSLSYGFARVRFDSRMNRQMISASHRCIVVNHRCKISTICPVMFDNRSNPVPVSREILWRFRYHSVSLNRTAKIKREIGTKNESLSFDAIEMEPIRLK